MLQTNSPVAIAFAAVSFCVPSARVFAAISTVGGSQVRFWNWLYGARLCRPCRSTVEIQPIGRGTTQDLNGSCFSPWAVLPGS